MNDRLLAEQFAAMLQAAPFLDFAALFPADSIFAAQASTVVAAPTLALHGEYESYLDFRKGTLSLEIRSRLGDEVPDGFGVHPHQNRFHTLYARLLGEAAGTREDTLANQAAAKAVVKAAIAEPGVVQLVEYGPARDAVEAGSEGDDLRTVLNLMVVWKFTV